MTNDEKSRLMELCGKATPGPWPYSKCRGVRGHGLNAQVFDSKGRVFLTHDRIEEQANHDVAFVSAANPQAIRELLDENESLRAVLEVELVDLEMTHQAVVSDDPKAEILIRLVDQKCHISKALGATP